MCGVQLLKDMKRAKSSKAYMLMLSLIETIVAMANKVHWHGHVLKGDGHVLSRALNFEIEDQRKKGKKYTEEAG